MTPLSPPKVAANFGGRSEQRGPSFRQAYIQDDNTIYIPILLGEILPG